MDDLETAVVSVSYYVPEDRAEEWFQTLTELIDEVGASWSSVTDTLVERTGTFPSEAAESFMTTMDSEVSDPDAVLALMAEQRDQLSRIYSELIASHGAAESSDEVEEWDEAAAAQWYEYLTTGQQWQGWSGREEEWDDFRSGFLYYADSAGVLPQATKLMDSIENSSAGKAGALTAIGVNLPEEQASQADWGEQTAAWYQYLTAESQVAGWSGREADWDDFRARFLQSAEAAAVLDAAQTFLDQIEAAGDKLQALADLGIELPVGAPTAALPDADPMDATLRIEAEVAAAMLEQGSELAERLGSQEEFERLVADVLRERAAVA